MLRTLQGQAFCLSQSVSASVKWDDNIYPTHKSVGRGLVSYCLCSAFEIRGLIFKCAHNLSQIFGGAQCAAAPIVRCCLNANIKWSPVMKQNHGTSFIGSNMYSTFALPLARGTYVTP